MIAHSDSKRIDTIIVGPGCLKAILLSRYGPPILLSILVGGCGPSRAVSVAPLPVPIERSERIETEGARLFLQVRGMDGRLPVLLWLHGGPGGAEGPLFRYFNGKLERNFVVVYWDQRGAGRSFDPKANPGRLTIRQHLDDLDTVVEHLRQSLGRNQIALIGHSWGGALGLLYVQAHPDKVSAFIAVAPLVSMFGAQQAQYAFVAAEAARRRDAATLKRLEQVGPPPYETAAEAMTMGFLSEKYGAVFHRPPHKLWVVFQAMLRGLVKPWEVVRFIQALHISLEAMHEELLGLDLEQSVPEVQVPVFFFLGCYDQHVDSEVAARYLGALRAPTKHLVWFENSAHNVPFEEPELFNASVVRALQSIGMPPDGDPPRGPAGREKGLPGAEGGMAGGCEDQPKDCRCKRRIRLLEKDVAQ